MADWLLPSNKLAEGENRNVSRDISISTIPAYTTPCETSERNNESLAIGRHAKYDRVRMHTREHHGIGSTDRQRDRPDFHPPANFPPLIGILGPVENSKPLIPTARTKTPIVDEGFERGTLIAFAYIRTFTALHTEAGADGGWGTSHRGVARRIR